MLEGNLSDRAPRGSVPARSVTRVRFEARLRLLTVRDVHHVTPHLIRIALTGDFTGFQTLGFDDHVKLFFADPDTGVLTLPQPNAVPPAGGPRPIARDYTPRRFEDDILTIDFAVHTAGPATAWALSAKPGDTLHVGGPRGSMLVPDAFDGYVLIGDDTALPAIARRLEDLPVGTPAYVVVEVDGPQDQIAFTTLADLTVHWVHRSAVRGPNTLSKALHGLFLPQNDVHVWVACEGKEAKLVREHLIDDHGVNPAWLKASGYWRAGEPGAHEKIDS